MTLTFRNLENVSPDSPVREWPTEAVLAALERGSLRDWRRLIRAIEAEPWGEVARKVEQALEVSRPYGVAGLMERAIERARVRTASNERDEIARQVRHHLQRSGLTQTEFAERIGTSASRLSTYITGKVTPSAALLLRMQRVSSYPDT